MLYIVSTPIGNLKDISYRAVKVLEEIDTIAAEDKRKGLNLLQNYNIDTKSKVFIPYHAKNELNASKLVLEKLNNGQSVALISEAGTPCISDPGYLIVKKAIAHNIKITHICGAAAFLSALVCSGLNATEFSYFGFMPKKQGNREKKIIELLDNTRTSIIYESGHRIMRTLDLIHSIDPDRYVCIAKEISKLHEDFIRGRANNIKKIILDDKSKIKDIRKKRTSEKITLKGEFVIVVEAKN